MKRLSLCLAALVIGAVFCADADAALFGRRRGGGGGGMGAQAAQGNGLCNMAKQSAVRPNQVVGGDFGIKAEPTPPAADSVTDARKSEPKIVKAARPSHVNFAVIDAPTSSVEKVARR